MTNRPPTPGTGCALAGLAGLTVWITCIAVTWVLYDAVSR